MSEKMLLGTYTKKTSQGIYQALLNTTTQKLETLTLVTEETNPTYLTTNQANQLFCVTKGGVASYNEELVPVNSVVQDKPNPCYVAFDEARQLLYAAFYHTGEVASYTVDSDGSLALVDMIQHTHQTGPHKNQDKAHVHYTNLTPDNRLAVCDLGTDEVYTYDVSENGHLTEVAIYHATPGSGPRHLVFHPNATTAYLINELNSTLTVLAYDQTNGTFTKKQEVSTLPADFTGENGGAAIRITRDGQFVYCANRGHNSLGVFRIAANDDQLTLVECVASGGDFPRDFNLSADDAYVVCANQNTDNLALFKRDATSGKLTLLQDDFEAPECVCVVFN
jgi:6-phosphogluconolactonase